MGLMLVYYCTCHVKEKSDSFVRISSVLAVIKDKIRPEGKKPEKVCKSGLKIPKMCRRFFFKNARIWTS